MPHRLRTLLTSLPLPASSPVTIPELRKKGLAAVAAHRSARIPDHELGRHLVQIALRALPLDQTDQNLCRHLPHLVDELIDGCQRRVVIGRLRDIVKADHRQVVGDGQARLARRLDRPDGRLIVGGKDRRRRLGQRQQLLGAAAACLGGEIADCDQLRIDRDVGLAQGVLVALQPLIGALQVGPAADKADPPVAQPDQVLHRRQRPDVVGGDNRQAAWGFFVGIDRHHRRVRGQAGGRRRDDHHPVGDAPVEQRHIVLLPLGRRRPPGAAAGVGDQIIVEVLNGPVHALHHLDRERVADVGHNQADDVRAVAAHAPRRQAGGIAQLLDDGLDLLVGIRRNVVLVVQHARHGRDRYPGLSGHISNGRRRPGPFHRFPSPRGQTPRNHRYRCRYRFRYPFRLYHESPSLSRGPTLKLSLPFPPNRAIISAYSPFP